MEKIKQLLESGEISIDDIKDWADSTPNYELVDHYED